MHTASRPRGRWSGAGVSCTAPFQRGSVPAAEEVKQHARALGADLVGIARADTLNAFPPDPLWPQTPERISPYCRSVVVIAQHIPAGAFRCKTNVPVQYMDMLVLRKMDKVAYRLAEDLEKAGYPAPGGVRLQHVPRFVNHGPVHIFRASLTSVGSLLNKMSHF